MHVADIHFPFEHRPGLNVAYQFADHVQPDATVAGSDAADFALISTFDAYPDIEEATCDVLDEFKQYWLPHVKDLKQRAPNAAIVYIWVNHERRIKKYLSRMAPKFRQRIMRDFIGIVRAGGSVLYLGDTDYVRMGPLIVAHGVRVGPSAAKNHLMDIGCQASIMAGHVHTPSKYETIGEDFAVKSIVSGCLCLPAHYHAGVRQNRRWQLETAIAEVDLGSREVNFTNLSFQTDTSSVWTRFERKLFAAPIERPEHLVTFEDYLVRT